MIDALEQAVAEARHLFSSNCVLVVSFALVQCRPGQAALRALADVLVPMLRPLGIDDKLHAAVVAALIAGSRRKLSLVDCTSFELMRRHGLTEALALDDDFTRQGFRLVPRPLPTYSQPASTE